MNKFSILIVEDDQATSELLSLMLASYGYAVTGIVTTGDRAIKTAIKAKPDLILMDIRLNGDIDGIMAFKEIRKVSQVPIIFISTFTNQEVMKRAMECNASGYLVKPFKKEALLSAVASALDWQRLNAE